MIVMVIVHQKIVHQKIVPEKNCHFFVFFSLTIFINEDVIDYLFLFLRGRSHFSLTGLGRFSIL